jgi:hypothetical protein
MQKGSDPVMRLLGHLWRVIVNLVVIAVVLAMFSVAESPFETIVVSGLVLIHQSVAWSTTMLTRNSIEQVIHIARLLLRVLRRLDDSEADEGEKGLKEAVEGYEALNVAFYINGTGTAIVWVIAIWQLLVATF